VRQFQRRIRLVDGILNFGFGDESEYSMTMYVPIFTNHHVPGVQTKNITLLRRDLKKKVTNPKIDLKETKVDWLMSIVTLG